eukprot:CCRYP_002593-RA/>CCRYP_002593-RA protein AED:0.37 eAED:0.37 QI:0/-1/0/1/-1/1/1/0/316
MRHPAKDADTVPGLAMNSLLSAGKLTDANYIAVFTKTDVNIFDPETTRIKADRQAILSGWRCPQTKLWRVPLKPTLPNLNTDTTLLSTEARDIMMNNRKHLSLTDFANSVYELPNTEQVITWYHASAGYPTKTTWLKAIKKGFYATWPLLTPKAVPRHFPESNETSKGHMHHIKSGIRSTKAQFVEPDPVQQAKHNLSQLRRKHKDVYMSVREATELAHTDQTGRFRVISSKGHKYIMVLVDIDSNYIAMEPMRSKEIQELISVYNTIMDKLASAGIKTFHTNPRQRSTQGLPSCHQKSKDHLGTCPTTQSPTQLS